MPHYAKLSRSTILQQHSAIVTPGPLLDFLLPGPQHRRARQECRGYSTITNRRQTKRLESSSRLVLLSPVICHQQLKSTGDKPFRTIKSRKAITTKASHESAEVVNDKFQRFTRDGRLIIETTNVREPANSYETEQERTAQVDQKQKHFAAGSRLPLSFFDDVNTLREKTSQNQQPWTENLTTTQLEPRIEQTQEVLLERGPSIHEQVELLTGVRELEERLAQAKKALDKSLKGGQADPLKLAIKTQNNSLTMRKEDYLSLVDLYFYSHNSRFSPESPDASPNPIIVEDYAFKLSADYSKGRNDEQRDDATESGSILADIDRALKNAQLREIAVMQVFVNLLLDDGSSNLRLFEAYQQFPKPGVAYLPKSVIRLFLQRMSVPGKKTKNAMMRYLSLIDDMQEARIPITVAEWSSAIHLAGRTKTDFRDAEVSRAFDLWRRMEHEAGVQSSFVTFNILFDIAARAGKFALAENVLAEMYRRDLRLNKLGRISLIYYHGLRGDGDGVRKAYHDYVEAGEIVTTHTLNCVIASLINAQEPTAAEQVYQRMKDLQKTFRRGRKEDGTEGLFRLHPAPGSSKIGDEMASNTLGRTLLRAANLKKTVPEAHERLQASMPLTPDFITYRSLISHHATVSGDLDRLTVLLSEMIEDFRIPVYPLIYQILFKGFALNGSKYKGSSTWTKKRLDMVWDACRSALKVGAALAAKIDPERLQLPTIREVYESTQTSYELSSRLTEPTHSEDQNKGPPSRKLSMWQELVVDLAAYPRERLRRLKRYHMEQFDTIPNHLGDLSAAEFQDTHYPAPQPELDLEEGEYTLPDPVFSSLYNPEYNPFDKPDDPERPPSFEDMYPSYTSEYDDPSNEAIFTTFNDPYFQSKPTSLPVVRERLPKHVDRPEERTRTTKGLVCWLLRAYTRVTSNRAQVEEIWNSVRKYWFPMDEKEVEVIMGVLRRCLQECDAKGSGGYDST